jgi:adenosylhomocysteine nucleosidase
MALAMESRGRLEALHAPLLFTGVGKVNATMALTRRLTELRHAGAPLPLVINLGTAGSRTLAAGSLVACHRFTQRDMDVTALGFPRGTTPFDDAPPVIECARYFAELPNVTCSTGDSFATDAHPIDGDVVDMEAYALARVCRSEGVDFACAKFITDGADGNAANDWSAALDVAARALANLYARAALGNPR